MTTPDTTTPAASRIKTEQELIDEDLRQYDDLMDKHYAECDRINGRILQAIRSVKGSEFYSDLERVIEWVQSSGKMEIVSERVGTMQSEAYRTITRVWVDQWSVGDSGDSFSGHVYVKIKLGKWLKMHFEC